MVNQSPFSNEALSQCLLFLSSGDHVVLLEDGVYAAMPSCPQAEALQQAISNQCKFYALSGDLEARGITSNIASGIEVVDYPDFVELATLCRSSQSWT